MPRKRHHYLGNPEFQYLHVEDEELEQKIQTKAQSQDHENWADALPYQIEGGEQPRRRDEPLLSESRDVGSEEEEEDLSAGTIRKLGSRNQRPGDGSSEKNDPLQRMGGLQRGAGSHGSPSHRLMSTKGPQPRELKVRLTKKLSSRMHNIRRFVDFTISNSNTSKRPFYVIKEEKDVYHLKNHDLLLRLRMTLITKRDEDDRYVKDYIAEFKFRGRLFKYNEEKESFVEVAVVSQCMAICVVAECRRVPTFNASFNRLSP